MNWKILKFNVWNDRNINSLKTGVACLIGFVVGEAMHLPQDSWIIISILVVMCGNVNVGGVIIQSYYRILSTIGGALIAVAVVLLFHHNFAAMALVIFLSGCFFCYLAGSKKQLGTLGGATVALVLTTHSPTLQYATQRTIEITLGIIIAVLVTRFVFPVMARQRLRNNLARNIRLLLQLYELNWKTSPSDHLALRKIARLEVAIIKAFADQNSLIEQSRNEPVRIKFKKNIFIKVINAERRLFRAITLLHPNSHPEGDRLSASSADLQAFTTEFKAVALELAQALEENEPMPSPGELLGSFYALEKPLMSPVSADDLNYVTRYYVHLFSLKQVAIQLRTLKRLCSTLYSDKASS